MITFTQLLDQYKVLTRNTTTANDTLGKTLINDSIRTICNLQGGKLRFLEATKDLTTVANQEAYQIPNGFRKLIDVMAYSDSGASSSSTIYSPEMVFDPTKWKLILQYRYGTQDVPYFVYVERTRLLIQPIPATTGNLIRLRGRLETSNLTRADYTTGSIVSITSGATALVGTGTSWNASMIGSYIQITPTSSANGGDGYWYEIAAVPTTTTITLSKLYEGTTIAAATNAYTIGQVPVVPSAYQPGILWRAVAIYWQQQQDIARAKQYWLQYDGGVEYGEAKEYGGLMGEMLANEGETEEGAYVPPFGSTSNLPQAPYYQPYQNASGFS